MYQVTYQTVAEIEAPIYQKSSKIPDSDNQRKQYAQWRQKGWKLSEIVSAEVFFSSYLNLL